MWPATSTSPSSLAPFTLNLKLGMTNSEVKLLQQYLNSHGFSVAESGPGSPGHETEYFGVATRVALINFQKAGGITPASGYFGPLTRAYIASH
jgi:peptidoglycan hydrolase-like protein with peptidoglycan-binding domain